MGVRGQPRFGCEPGQRTFGGTGFAGGRWVGLGTVRLAGRGLPVGPAGILAGGADDQDGVTADHARERLAAGRAPAAAVVRFVVALVQLDAGAVEVGTGKGPDWLVHGCLRSCSRPVGAGPGAGCAGW